MKHIVAILLIAIASLYANAVDPDFAYPKTTLDNAVKNYEQAIQNRVKSKTALTKSLLEMIGATSAIDGDSVVNIVPWVQRAIEATTDCSEKALLLTVKAELLGAIYNGKRYVYDRRETPDAPLPADISEWNGNQFNAEISKDLTDAFTLAMKSPDTPIDEYSQVISADRLSRRFFPTIASFVALKATNLLNVDQSKQQLQKIVDDMIELSRKGSSAYFYWKVVAIDRFGSDMTGEKAKLYFDNCDNEASGYALAKSLENYSKSNAPEWAVGALSDFIAKFPDYWDISTLKNKLALLTLPEVNINCKTAVAPGVKFDINLKYSYTQTAGFEIYSIPEEDFRKRRFQRANAVELQSFSVNTDPSVASGDTTVSVTVAERGYLAILPAVDGETSRFNEVFVQNLPYVPILLTQDSKKTIAVVDYVSGKPLEGAVISEKVETETFSLGATNNDGFITFTPQIPKNLKKGAYNYSVAYNISYEGATDTFFRSNAPLAAYSRQVAKRAKILANRALYHLGDTIGWATIAYNAIEPDASICADETLRIELRDPNGQTVDSLTATTDALGRACGQFFVPREGLTGSFCIFVTTAAAEHNDFLGMEYVTVSDFKLPTFAVKPVEVERGGDSVTLRSAVQTYAGMPVAGAKVEIEIWEAMRWRMFSPYKKISAVSSETKEDGTFIASVADSLLNSNDSKCYTAKITVTSQNGEAQSASVNFTTGKPYELLFGSSTTIFNTSDSIVAPFEAYNATGTTEEIEVEWWLTATDSRHLPSEAVACGRCLSGNNGSIWLGDAPAGNWTLSLAPVDITLADSVANAATLTLYNIQKGAMPSDYKLFTPKNNVTADAASGKASVMFGTPDDTTYVYRSFVAGNRLVSFDLEMYGKGFHSIDVTLPDSVDSGSLYLFTVNDGTVASSIIVVNRDNRRRLHLEGLAMRDRITSGSNERWTLKLADADNRAQSGGMIATMFNAALNALTPYSLSTSFNISRVPSHHFLTRSYKYPASANIAKDIKPLEEKYLTFPQFSPSISLADLRSYKFMARAGTIGSADGESVATTLSAETIEEDAAVGYNSAATIHIRGTNNTADVVAPDMPSESDESKFEYRSGEVLQAFWRPQLNFDENGETTLSFTVPDANTTWSLNAFAWTSDLRAVGETRQLVSSKPVMVTPLLPRFLRTGDEARLTATVYNNSDSTASVKTVAEIFDIVSGEVKSRLTSIDTIAAGASTIVAIVANAWQDATAIGYRVRSTLGKFTDAEQDFISVISADADVVESENFYLNSGDESFTTVLPQGEDMATTLTYTANPAWDVVKALPGLSTDDAKTSTGAARQLFGAAVATGLVKDYPAIAKVLAEWTSESGSEALVSRLSTNEELKIALLNATPWVQAAASDSERMARLALLLDRSAAAQTMDRALTTLTQLQNADGGWSWGGWDSQSSVWATRTVLLTLGRLNAISYLPADRRLEAMVSKAMAYCESKLSSKTKTDGTFTLIASMLPQVQLGLRGHRIVTATVESYVDGWKSASTTQKAIEALVLDANGHKAVAKTVMSSLREFAVPSANQGTSFPSVTRVDDYAALLCAFARIAPDKALIDGMRQWLTLRTQTTSQLGSCDPTLLIAAYTATGAQWLTDDAEQTDITVGTTKMPVDNAERATGHFVLSLPSDAMGERLIIHRTDSHVPAYGAVLSRYTKASSEVKAEHCDAVSIEKRVTALRDGRWQFVDDVRLGERVRILLTIKVKRDLEYVAIVDQRAAAFEPVDQLPGYVWSGGTSFYRENRNSSTNLYINRLTKGTYQIAIDMTASVTGQFTSGIATIQSQLSPEITAHSSGLMINVLEPVR